MAGKDFGGFMTFRLSTGERFAIRGNINGEPVNFDAESVTNQNGSLSRTLTPKPYKIEVTLERHKDLAKVYRARGFNVSIRETQTGVTHLASKCFFEGTMQENHLTGEVTGLTLVAEQYRRIGD